MTVYSDFSPDEQQLLRSSLQAAAEAVAAASIGRHEETASEGFAAASFILESRPEYVDNRLVTSLIVELERRLQSEQRFPEFVDVVRAPEARERAMETLRSAAALVDARAPADEAAGYRRWLLRIATITAEAGKEDQGFLGTGGVQVNEAERAALAEVATVLGLEPPGSRR